MDMRFQAIIEAAVKQAKVQQSLLWADVVAERIASSTPLKVRAADISEQISLVAARAGVPVTVMERQRALRGDCCEQPAA